MSSRATGGSRSTIPPRKRRKRADRKETAYARAVELLSEEKIAAIRREWASWETGVGGREWEQSEGAILQLLQQGLSERVIRAILPVGGSRIARLRTVLKEGVDTLHTRRTPAAPWHAFSDLDLAAFKTHCSTWILDDGFPCPHRRPRQFFNEAGLTWTVVHARYQDDVKRDDPSARTMSYSRFIQYVRKLYPGVRLTRTTEDDCDCCTRLDIQLRQEDITPDERKCLLLQKQMHLAEAISQRRFVSSFIRNYTALHAPEQYLPCEIIPDTADDNDGNVDCMENVDDAFDAATAESGERPSNQHCRVQIQAEDYGGGISMPYFGHSRPSIDYYNSNLILQNFVVADISNSVNHVFFYDERAQGKDADALCSLRLLYHLKKVQEAASNCLPAAEVSFSLLDNCVGQNKSKAVLMFFAMLSIVFPYRKVVLCFLLPGHSHNVADRVIAWCRKATQGLNLYTPMDLLKEVNKVKGVNSAFFDHNDSKRPFFVDWNALLSKYFLPPPAGYTANYLFEIDQGTCTARKTVGTPESESISFAMLRSDNIDSIRRAVLAELFGPAVTDILQASIASVQLPRHPIKELAEKKLKSLSAKYFTIPPQYLHYYPSVPEAILDASVQADSIAETPDSTDEGSQQQKKPKRRPGRPRKKQLTTAQQPTINAAVLQHKHSG